MKLFIENKMNEYLNDNLLDDNKFTQRALDSLHYWDVDEIAESLKKIFSEIGYDEFIRYAVELFIRDKYNGDDIIDTLYYIAEAGDEE